MRRPWAQSHLIMVTALCGSIAGCAKNAILEMEIELPANPDPPSQLFAVTQVRRADDFTSFTALWSGEDPPAIPLGTEPTTDHISVEATNEEIDVNVRIRFCKEAGCTHIDDSRPPETWYQLEHPFYVGEHTFWKESIASVPTDPPTEPTFVDKCKIRGCTVGDESTSYCLSDGTHLCE